jgi:predicted unusual protein kinase regulating ubiquinone biosynthesis (AarF/ABC1/UbiB family)
MLLIFAVCCTDYSFKSFKSFKKKVEKKSKMFRALHVTSKLGFSYIKSMTGMSAADPTQCLQQLGGVYAKATQIQRMTDPTDKIYNECEQINEAETKARLEEHLRSLHATLPVKEMSLLATGSIGAVYLVHLHTGEIIVCKVQYVGIDKIWIEDIKTMKYAMKVKDLIGKKRIMEDRIIEGLENMMKNELDYTKECRHTTIFYELFKNHPEICTPRPRPEFSSSTVLVTMPVRGQTMIEFLKTASPEQKGRIARNLVEFSHLTNLKRGALYCDYHWGNMRVENGKLVMLDFGMVDMITPLEIEATSKYMYYAIFKQFEPFSAVIEKQYPRVFPYVKAYYDIVAHLTVPYCTPQFTYTAGYIKEMTRLLDTYEGDAAETAWSLVRSVSMLAHALEHMGVQVAFQPYVERLRVAAKLPPSSQN